MTFNINDIITRLVKYQIEVGDIEIRLSDDWYDTAVLLELLADAMQEIEISDSINDAMESFDKSNVIQFPVGKTN